MTEQQLQEIEFRVRLDPVGAVSWGAPELIAEVRRLRAELKAIAFGPYDDHELRDVAKEALK